MNNSMEIERIARAVGRDIREDIVQRFDINIYSDDLTEKQEEDIYEISLILDTRLTLAIEEAVRNFQKAIDINS